MTKNQIATESVATRTVGSAAEIVCASCQRPNRADCQFCSSCGGALWTDCPSCAARCAVSESFCSVCGVNRHEIIQQQAADLETAFELARQMESEHDYAGAISVLFKVSNPKHTQLESLTGEARQMIERLKEARGRLQVDAEKSLEKAQELMNRHAYSDIVSQLDKIPLPFRTKAISELLSLARLRDAEVASLIDQVRETAATHRYEVLASALEQLLTLQPEHRLGLRLASQLCGRFCRLAKKHSMHHQYDEALKMLAAIPPTSRDKQAKQLTEQIRDLTWMFDEVRQATVITPTVVALAQRLRKAVPEDKKAVALHDKIQRLASQPVTSKRFPFPAWATAGNSPQIGCLAKWLPGIRTLEASSSHVQAVLNRFPGRFFVAIGLALQGLDETAIKMHLRPPAKRSVFGKLSGGQRKQQVPTAWGIDVGEHSLKAIKLCRNAETGAISIETAMLIDHANVSNPADAVAQQHSILAASLKQFRGKAVVERSDRICCNLHGQKVLGRFLKTPWTTPKKLVEIVKFEASGAIPCPLDELTLVHHGFPKDVDPNASDQDVISQRVLMVAAKQQDVRERLRVFEEADLHVDVLQADAIALYNFAIYDCLSETARSPSDPQPLAILDVGTRATNLVVCSQRGIWFRTLRFGGSDFTEAILRPFSLTYEQAEQLKQQPTRARSVSRLYKELDSVLSRFVAELQRSLVAYEKDNPGPRVAKMLGVGGGFQMHGLLRRLTS